MTEKPVVLTTLPIVCDLVEVLPAAKWIYYRVDDFSVWPGYDGETMGTMERELVPKVQETIAVSDTLAWGLRIQGANPVVITHGVDLAHWRRNPVRISEIPELAGLQGPYIVFWGVIDRRMDTAWVAALNDALQAEERSGTIVLFGPHEDPDPRLRHFPKVTLRGAVPFDRLPIIASHANALIMPYQDMPATQAMQPLKLKEYLATGLPVVVRALPATTPWYDACDVCADAETFVRSVLIRLKTGTPEEQAYARRRLASESWEAKASLLEKVIDATTGEAQHHGLTSHSS